MATLALTIGASFIPGGKVISALTMALAGGVGSFLDQNFILADLNGEESAPPSLGSFQANMAEEGASVNYCIGEFARIPANIVYAGPVQEDTQTAGGRGKRGEAIQTTYWRDCAYGVAWNPTADVRQIDFNGRAVKRDPSTNTPSFSYEIGNALGEVSFGPTSAGFAIESVQTWELYPNPWSVIGPPTRFYNGWRLMNWEMKVEFEEGSIEPELIGRFPEGERCKLRWFNNGVEVFPPGITQSIEAEIRESTWLGAPQAGAPVARMRLNLEPYFVPFRHPNPQVLGFTTEDPVNWWAGPRSVFLTGFGQVPTPPPSVLPVNYPGPSSPVAVTPSGSRWEFEYDELGLWPERTWRPGASDPEFWDGSEGVDQTSPIMEAFLGAGNVPGNQSRSLYVFQDLNISKHGGALPTAVFYMDARRKNSDASIRDTTIAEAIYWLMGDLAGLPTEAIDTGFDPAAETSTELTGTCRGYSLQSLSEMSKHISKFLIAYDLFVVEHSGRVIVREHGQRDRVDVPWGDLGARQARQNVTEPIQMEDQEEVASPNRQNVRFSDFNKDLQKGSQHSNYDGTMRQDGASRTTSQIDLGTLAIDSFVGRDIAERVKRRGIRRGRQSSIQLPLRFIHITPGDVLPIAVPPEANSEYAGKTLFFTVDAKRMETTLFVRLDGTVDDAPPDGWSYIP